MGHRETAKAMVEKIMSIYPITTQGWRHTEPIERLQGAIAKALAREREAAIDECLRIVKAECELPGPMPDEMWEAIKDDKDAAAELARIGVRKTKWNIAVAIEALKAVGVNQAAG